MYARVKHLQYLDVITSEIQHSCCCNNAASQHSMLFSKFVYSALFHF